MVRGRYRRVLLAGVAMGVLGAAMWSATPTKQAVAQVPSNSGGDKGQPLASKDISLDQAYAAVAAAVKKAAELQVKEDIAIVDAGGNLKAFARMDGAWTGSIDIAQKKAKTARMFDMPTEEIGKLSQPGGPLYMIEISNRGLITFPGGVPIKLSDGSIIGAIGASGTTVDKDKQIAEAGAAAVK
jgi:uncharacterized protein GlcG (DUF336 family)